MYTASIQAKINSKRREHNINRTPRSASTRRYMCTRLLWRKWCTHMQRGPSVRLCASYVYRCDRSLYMVCASRKPHQNSRRSALLTVKYQYFATETIIYTPHDGAQHAHTWGWIGVCWFYANLFKCPHIITGNVFRSRCRVPSSSAFDYAPRSLYPSGPKCTSLPSKWRENPPTFQWLLEAAQRIGTACAQLEQWNCTCWVEYCA